MLEAEKHWFFDTVVLSNFALVDSLSLIQKRYAGHIFLTTEVLDEIASGISTGYSRLLEIYRLIDSDVFTEINLNKEERRNYLRLSNVLGSGEASCIAVVEARNGIVATDDRVARLSCNERSLPFTGTIGILKACCLDCIISSIQADTILQEMIANGFYSPVKKMSDII